MNELVLDYNTRIRSLSAQSRSFLDDIIEIMAINDSHARPVKLRLLGKNEDGATTDLVRTWKYAKPSDAITD